ncbi:dipeptide epimerase [Halobacillus amylolyticus]|uniref:Dipeptide epimerase n=1 Tax=Halobacillus amylolyticus TaxID=2932259 RepID=A0ABY4HA38_9BACI|nr:dipeptide epimerase [Halobacillus amylolyticus]UOR10815.1 dipeptide epimerase [Halobacillus amylolyticus]
MKIIDLTCQKRPVKLKRTFKTALRHVTEIDVVDVHIKLEDGLTGIGSASSTWQITGESLEGIVAAVNGPIREVVLNKNIFHLRKISETVEKSCAANTSAKAAVDIALHDAYCKTYGIPLYGLLGGKINSLETDMTVSIDEPEIMYEAAQKRVAEGFNVLKIKVGNDQKLDLRRIEKVRSAVGNDVLLRLDANQGWNGKQAVEIIHLLEREKMGIELVEQPVPVDDLEGLNFVRERVSTPIMADESVFSPRDAFRLVKNGAVDLLNIKLMKCGGVRRAWQIADMCEAAGVQCMIGSMMESIVSVTAASHLAAAHPNITYYDLDAPLWMEDEKMKGGMRFEGNAVHLPDVPGIGFYN